MVAVLRTPLNNFNHPVMRDIFSSANLGPINDQIARRYTDAEAL